MVQGPELDVHEQAEHVDNVDHTVVTGNQYHVAHEHMLYGNTLSGNLGRGTK